MQKGLELSHLFPRPTLMKIYSIPLLLCLLAFWGPVQTVQSQRVALPPIQSAGANLDVAEVKTLVPNVHLVFNRMPKVAELARLTHTRNRGVIVLNLAASPTVAECVRLIHLPKGWKTLMILPRTVAAKDLRNLVHMRTNVEVVIPGLHPAQVDALLEPYKNVRRSAIPERVCAHLIRF